MVGRRTRKLLVLVIQRRPLAFRYRRFVGVLLHLLSEIRLGIGDQLRIGKQVDPGDCKRLRWSMPAHAARVGRCLRRVGIRFVQAKDFGRQPGSILIVMVHSGHILSRGFIDFRLFNQRKYSEMLYHEE